MKNSSSALLTFALISVASPAFANVLVSAPQNAATVGPQTTFVATANTTSCSHGVAAMGIYVDDHLTYVVNGQKLNAAITMSPGKHHAVVQEWDFCGGATKSSVPLTVVSSGGVVVNSPISQSTIGPLASYVASATSNCPSGVSAIGIYLNQQLLYKTKGANLNAQVTLPAGLNHTVVQEWDACGSSSNTPVDVTVASTGQVLKNLQASGGWKSSGQIAPLYNDCIPYCPGVTWSMTQGISQPSLSGNATRFDLGGTTPYSDALFFNQLIGDFSTQGLPDLKRTLVPSLHDFTYDTDFYASDAAHTQAFEFDINWFMNSVGITWGTECRVAGGNEWDIWDNVNAHWIPTGFSCNPIPNAWNHVTVKAKRGPNSEVIYESITLNGNTMLINKTYAPFQVPANWFGITVNYQIDGDRHQTPISGYADNLSLSYQ